MMYLNRNSKPVSRFANKRELHRNCVKGHALTLGLYISLFQSSPLLPIAGRAIYHSI